jgi:hypothetical protein
MFNTLAKRRDTVDGCTLKSLAASAAVLVPFDIILLHSPVLVNRRMMCAENPERAYVEVEFKQLGQARNLSYSSLT